MGIDSNMLARVSPPLKPRQVKRLSWEIAGAFGAENFYIIREHNWRALEIRKRFEQDGPDILPKPGEQFICVRLVSRYYGEGYERGDLPVIVGVADWLERRIPQEPGAPSVSIWYGGDSSGVCASAFGAKRRTELLKHFATVGHRPYRDGWGDGGMSRHCGYCDEPMQRYLWGGHGQAAGFACEGCGLTEESRDGGRTWAEKERER